MIEVYAPSSEIEGERIVSFLKSEGIEANLQISPQISQIPTSNTITIFVPVESRKKAIELIANARLDQIITDTGMFL